MPGMPPPPPSDATAQQLRAALKELRSSEDFSMACAPRAAGHDAVPRWPLDREEELLARISEHSLTY